ncbi:MAG: tetratricopeptide repeat protein, partial [Nostoc sp.]
NAVKLKSDDSDAWYLRSIALLNLERYEDALASTEQSLKFKGDLSAAWENRALALDELGRYDEAIASYDQAIEFQRDNSNAWYNRGIVLLTLERFEEAIASNERAIEFQHDFPQAWCNRGIALMDLGRFEEALASIDRSLEFQRDLPEAWYNRANTFYTSDRSFPLRKLLVECSSDRIALRYCYQKKAEGRRQEERSMNENSHLQGIKPSLKQELLIVSSGKCHEIQSAQASRSASSPCFNPTFLNVGSLLPSAFPTGRCANVLLPSEPAK